LGSHAVPATELREYVHSLAAEIASRNPIALERAKAVAHSELDLPFNMAVKMDETISHRLRFYTDALADVEGYLKSQKGGTNLGFKFRLKPDRA
jgi:3-hydroxypropionyl-coenzyme A dehydratase/trans-feruloyl-CoA hydratase/vanillin synthase